MVILFVNAFVSKISDSQLTKASWGGWFVSIYIFYMRLRKVKGYCFIDKVYEPKEKSLVLYPHCLNIRIVIHDTHKCYFVGECTALMVMTS